MRPGTGADHLSSRGAATAAQPRDERLR